MTDVQALHKPSSYTTTCNQLAKLFQWKKPDFYLAAMMRWCFWRLIHITVIRKELHPCFIMQRHSQIKLDNNDAIINTQKTKMELLLSYLAEKVALGVSRYKREYEPSLKWPRKDGYKSSVAWRFIKPCMFTELHLFTRYRYAVGKEVFSVNECLCVWFFGGSRTCS